ncbi:MAG: NYN domain-containing protein [Bacteroidales bacterium]|nr:NYN domain-containing protein [Bacteroidales bacterium]
MQKVIVYVDGFNFYYGLKKNHKWRRFYWLDVVKFFELFMKPDQELVRVKYFSAKPDNVEKALRQNAFFQANKENPKFQLMLGKYLRKNIRCYNCGYQIQTYEEKESDVRLATQIVNDANNHNCDVAIVVSADSDMIPAVELALKAGTKVFVYFPPFHYSNSLSNISTSRVINLERYESRFRHCILPDTVHLSLSNFDLTIPEKWKEYQSYNL